MVEYKQKYLKQNHANQRPQRMLFLDTETVYDQVGEFQRHTMDIGWTYYCRRNPDGGFREGTWKFHDTALSLNAHIDSLSVAKTTLYLFAHNAFFDLQASGFFRYFSSDGWRLSFIYDSGLTYILSIRKGSRTIKVLSTTNFFTTTLAKLGETIGYEKLKVDFESASPEELKRYCKRDVEIMVKAMESYIALLDDEDLGNFGLTRASQSFSAYRHRFLEATIVIHDDPKTLELERAAYMGGRTEAFFIGAHSGTDFVTLDVNSMYPYIMKTFPMPAELKEYLTDVTLTDLEVLLTQFCGVAKVKICTPRQAYAKRFNGKIIFPVGEFSAYLSTPGLQYALEHGDLVAVDELALYRREFLFTKYVDHFYAMRQRYNQENNAVYSYMVKIFMNSLYGKFGQTQPIEEKVCIDAPDQYYKMDIIDTITGETTSETLLMNMLITTGGKVNGANSLVPIPSHITEYGRLILWKIIEQIGVDNVLYCDTDSIKIERRYMDSLSYPIDATALGALKIESASHDLTIHGCKDYETENEKKLKGVPKSAEDLGNGTYRYDSFQGQATHLRFREMDAYLVRKVTKNNLRLYTKGSINPSGRVVPYRFYDFE